MAPDPEYVQGQIDALRALILGLANLLLEREEFRDEALQRLETVRTALLSEPVSEARLQAIDDMERWLRTLTRE